MSSYKYSLQSAINCTVCCVQLTVQFAMSSKLYSLQSPRFVGVCFHWGSPVWIFIPHSLLTLFASSMHTSVATHTCAHAHNNIQACTALGQILSHGRITHHSMGGSPSWPGLVHLWGIVVGRNLNNQLYCGQQFSQRHHARVVGFNWEKDEEGDSAPGSEAPPLTSMVTPTSSYLPSCALLTDWNAQWFVAHTNVICLIWLSNSYYLVTLNSNSYYLITLN